MFFFFEDVFFLESEKRESEEEEEVKNKSSNNCLSLPHRLSLPCLRCGLLFLVEKLLLRLKREGKKRMRERKEEQGR